MRKIYALCFIFIFSIAKSQEPNLNPNLITYPASPEASGLGTYGNVPINLFTGKLQKEITLFEGKVSGFNLPLKLNYNYAGNRVEETPSIIGLGWQLNTGGIVTREVRGLPDHYDNNYYNFLTSYEGSNLFNLGKIKSSDAEKILNGSFDTEPDKYHVSVNGISFSFKIGLDGMPVFLSKHNNKIEVTRSLQNNNHITSFILTDSNSNKYFFEDIESTELIAGAVFENVYYNSYDLLNPLYYSSWHLTKIVTNNNYLINYSYENYDYTSYSFAAVGTNQTGIPANCQDCNFADTYEHTCNVYLIKRKLLTLITCDFFSINFSIDFSSGVKLYNQIKIQNPVDVTKYNFFIEVYSNQLLQIKKNDIVLEQYEYYSRDNGFVANQYDNVKNQDLWGFANGANNLYMVNVPGTNYRTDRKPRLGTTLGGALKMITYPTGGNTKFFYELNSVPSDGTTDRSNEEPNVRIDLKFKTDNLFSAPSNKQVSITKTFATDAVAVLSHNRSHKDYVTISIASLDVMANPYTLIYDDSYNIALPNIRNISYNEIPTFNPSFNFNAQIDNCTSYVGCPAPCNCAENVNSAGKFILPAGTYEFKISSEFNRTHSASGQIILDFYDSSLFTGPIEKLVGGLRVKKTIDTSAQGDETVKFYEYKQPNGISSGEPYSSLVNTGSFTEKHGCNDPGSGNGAEGSLICRSYISEHAEYYSSSHNPLLNNGTPVYYTNVKESTNPVDVYTPSPIPFICSNCISTSTLTNHDNTKVYSFIGDYFGTKSKNFPNGYKIYNYLPPSKVPWYKIPEGDDLSIGRIESTQTYSSSINNSIDKLIVDKKTGYLEQLNLQLPSNYPKGIKVTRKILLTGCSYQTPGGLSDPFFLNPIINNPYYFFDSYKDSDVEYFVNNTNTKEYYNDQPIENNVAIAYDSHNQQKTITTTDSNNNTQTNELFYPYDFADATSVNMASKNFISPVVKVVNKENGTVLDSYKWICK